METSRKKALEIMQKGITIYHLLCNEYDVSDHFGDGFDLIAEKEKKFVKIELKAIDLNSIKNGNRATQYVSANEIVIATHLIITVFKGVEINANYIMSIRQFVENSGVKKFDEYKCFEEFIAEYKELAVEKSKKVKNSGREKSRLDFDFNFNPSKTEEWRFASFKDQWGNLL